MANADTKLEQAKCLALMCDGWTNINGTGLVNFLLATPEPIFLKVVDKGDERETGEYLANHAISIIREKGSDKFLLVVSDNASNMKKIWRLFKREFPHITAVGCGAHCLDLVVKDIVKFPGLLKHFTEVKMVVRTFKNSHLLLAVLKKKSEGEI